jgi:hypothetical protein
LSLPRLNIRSILSPYARGPLDPTVISELLIIVRLFGDAAVASKHRAVEYPNQSDNELLASKNQENKFVVC